MSARDLFRFIVDPILENETEAENYLIAVEESLSTQNSAKDDDVITRETVAFTLNSVLNCSFSSNPSFLKNWKKF